MRRFNENSGLPCNDRGITYFTAETLNRLDDFRKDFPPDGPQMKNAIHFLERYGSNIDFSSNSLLLTQQDESAVEDPLVSMITAFDGEPFQSLLYNILIYNLPVESWPYAEAGKRHGENSETAEKLKAAYAALSETMGKIYYRQWQLNYAIGRAAFQPSSIDYILFSYVRSEIQARFPFLDYFLKKASEHYARSPRHAKNLFTYGESIDREFCALYIQAYLSCPLASMKPGTNMFPTHERMLIKELRKLVKSNTRSSINGTSSFWRILTDSQPITREHNFLDTACSCNPCKDDLYVFCLACRYDLDKYYELRKLAVNDAADAPLYADNTMNARDYYIQRSIRNVDRVYHMVYNKNFPKHTNDAEKERCMAKERFLPFLVLISVDRVLYHYFKNLCDVPEDYLLLHRFMMVDHHISAYREELTKWKKTHPTESVIDFEYHFYDKLRENWTGRYKRGEEGR